MAADAHLLTDLRLERRDLLEPPTFRVSDTQDDGPPSPTLELDTVTGRTNLGQAVTMRLLTPLGELTALGHPTYGSRLHELFGSPNTATVRGRVRLAVLEALAAERRIGEIVDVVVAPADTTGDISRRHLVVVTATVRSIPAGELVQIGPITLELAA